MHGRLVDPDLLDRDARRVESDGDLAQLHLLPGGHRSAVVPVGDGQRFHSEIPLEGHQGAIRVFSRKSERSIQIKRASIHSDTRKLLNIWFERLNRDIFQRDGKIGLQRLHSDIPLRLPRSPCRLGDAPPLVVWAS